MSHSWIVTSIDRRILVHYTLSDRVIVIHRVIARPFPAAHRPVLLRGPECSLFNKIRGLRLKKAWLYHDHTSRRRCFPALQHIATSRMDYLVNNCSFKEKMITHRLHARRTFFREMGMRPLSSIIISHSYLFLLG